jgi:hypothetical protein
MSDVLRIGLFIPDNLSRASVAVFGTKLLKNKLLLFRLWLMVQHQDHV